MKVFSLFSGIGAFEKALQNLEIPLELSGFSEIDKYAVKSYCAIHSVDESMLGFESNAREYDEIMPTITSREYKEPRVVNETKLKEVDTPTLKQIGQIYGTEKEPNPQAGRIYDADGISPTLDTCTGGNRMPKVLFEPTIQRVDIPQTVKVRKYEVDTKKLCEVLREAKRKAGETAYGIAEVLDVSHTKVAHWFRQDDCFAIPDPDIWMQLKRLLKIDTDEFDEAIMTFEEKKGVYEKSERHYSSEGIAPTLTSATAAEKVIEPSLRIRKLTPKECFRLMGFSDEDFSKAEAVNSNTQLYKQAGNSIGVPVCEYILKALFDCGVLEK